MSALGWIIILLILAAILIVLAALFYQRATNEVSLVRTGIGGRKVVIDGGTLAIPYFHEVGRVNMQTIRMDVTRTGDSALITKDRMRIDVGAEFYTSVVPEKAAVVRASQTLGRRTFQADQLKSLVDGMMVDALRAVAAQMTMDELHENRGEFVRQVHEALSGTLSKYGLQLDSVSLTSFDQTPFSALDENNAFNAVGMRKLAEVIAKSKKERAEIEGESQVSVRRAEVDSNRRKLEIELEQRRAEIQQTQEIELLLAQQLTEVARRKAEAETAAAEARIGMERAIQSASIAREQIIREAEINQARALEIAEQDRSILISAKSQEESQAKAEAADARAAVITAEENLLTVRQVAEAERRKRLARLAAEQDAEAQATRVRITSESDQIAAKTRGLIRREEADTLRIQKKAEADGEAARIEAENTRSPELAAMEMEKARLAALPAIIGEMVKPAEKIKGISINHITGLSRSGEPGERMPSPVDQTISSILDMAVTLPTMKKLGDALGMNLENLVPEEPRKS
ncbi:Inner membrane protein YqiK [Neorhizobium galegae bv. officinalis]|uniref:Inner membrane protein YqiK n=1 Tax=Neorhizobium galegae bv. officinalis TaxID=323656 RepID=A0A0T7FBK7_NEOGA|nr:flotillin domain-containing protein [Neorhizobium galegae]CDZ32425.1 Inner membrane protein YqiK [Neorhizobium galegae bv. officinalis]